MESNDITEYYDNFIADQLKSGINDRIFHLYKMLLRFGLTSESNVLELGSGIGTLTFLIAKHVKRGKIEAVDLSPKSIHFSKQRIKSRNVSFAAHNIVTYKPAITRVDFITLFDIIEHIPIADHPALFQNLADIADDHTKILINIPNPAYIEYDQLNAPETLQIIDQPIALSSLLRTLEEHGFCLMNFETYSIWVENDYQFLMLEKKKLFKEVKLSSQRNFFQKARKKIERTYVQFRHRYH
jgi:trans-aconitate 2-methyltransferase